MTDSTPLLWAAACSSVSRAETLNQSLGGTVYADHRADTSKLPFAALVTGVTDNLDLLKDAADVGLYIVCARTIKAGSAKIYGLSPMLAHPQLNHKQADDHWRDTHAPLALTHHAYMTHYVQLSVVHTLSGRPFDGFALCGFATLEDLRERFFSEPDSREVILADINTFADTQRSPRRLLATPHPQPTEDSPA